MCNLLGQQDLCGKAMNFPTAVMAEKSLREALDFGMFSQKRVCIDEVLPQDVTFLVIDVSDVLGASVFAFNETSEHYKEAAESHGKRISVRSIYDGEYQSSDVVDDVWTARHVYGIDADCRFSVYRANSCRKADWYKYDMIVRVEPLESGVSAEVDGRISVFDRKRRYIELKYKIMRDRVVCHH